MLRPQSRSCGCGRSSSGAGPAEGPGAPLVCLARAQEPVCPNKHLFSEHFIPRDSPLEMHKNRLQENIQI